MAQELGVTLVTPWFGTPQPGGAERLARLYAECLVGRVGHVRVATTTSRGALAEWSRSYFSPREQAWPYPAEGPVPGLVRFPADSRRQVDYNALNARIVARLAVSLTEEETWVRQSINSHAMIEWLSREAAGDMLIVMPYPFGLSYTTTFTFGPRVVLVPCLHREGYAALSYTCEMFERAGGFVFNTPEEAVLAEGLYRIGGKPRTTAVPPMVETEIPTHPDARNWRRRHTKDRPFLLYLGWRDPAKGLDFLMACFAEALHRLKDLDGPTPMLALAGPGDIEIPQSLTPHVVDLGYLAPEEKSLALRATDWLIHPSLNESFSFVLMEAWRQETPCLVHALCDVTRAQVERAEGGLYFANGEELGEILRWSAENPDRRAQLGQQGAKYARAANVWEGNGSKILELLHETARRAGLASAASPA